jgi:hypothetical protein
MKVPLALLAALLLLAPEPRIFRVPHPDYGVVTSVQFLDGLTLLRLRDLGVGSVRTGLGWDLVESSKGRFDFSQVQPWIDQGHAAGLHIFATLGDPPPWAAPCPSCMPNSLFEWYDYVYHVLAHFKYLGSDITFGIWNEPNLGKFFNPPLPERYGDLFDYADMARVDANPAARLAGPETEHGAFPSGWFSTALTRLEARFRPQDVVTVHWYPGKSSPDLTAYMQNVLSRVGTRETWLTETGKLAVDDQEQALGVLDIVQTFNRRSSAQWAKLFIYRLYGAEPSDADTPYQFLRADALLSPRPSFDVYGSHMFRTFTVNLQASSGEYLSAESGGGSAIHANRNAAGPWETFEIDDLNGGSLMSGDLVRMRTSIGTYVRVTGPDRPLEATDTCGCNVDGLFTVFALAPGSVADGNRIALRSHSTVEFASAVRGGDVLVNRPTAGASEAFRLTVH